MSADKSQSSVAAEAHHEPVDLVLQLTRNLSLEDTAADY